MKAVMYHYVRKEDLSLPGFVYLHASDFEKQINYFNKNFRVLNKEEIYDCIEHKKIIDNGIILTFDDGLKDHYKYVFPILKERGLVGIFYIPSLPFFNKKLLDVHRVHYLLGRFGGKRLCEALTYILKSEYLLSDKMDMFASNTYQKQVADVYTKQFKQMLNYCIRPDKKTMILDQLMEQFQIDEESLMKDYYLTSDETQEMVDGGMIVGSHSHSHTLLSNLDKNEQLEEISFSIDYLNQFVNNNLDTFCYPYGGKLSYNDDTLSILAEKNIKFAFSVESRDIMLHDIEEKYEIPRYDCNEFPHGKATGI